MTPKHTKILRTKKTKLEQVLQQLETGDLRKLKKFIASPYFNSNQQIINLYNIYTAHLKLEKSLPTNAELWLEIGAKGGYNDVRYRKYESDLTQLVMKFLASEELLADQTSIYFNVMKAARKKGIRAIEKTITRNLDSLLNKDQSISIEHIQNKLIFEKERYLLEFKNKRIQNSNLNEILNLLDQYYISEKFKFATDLKSRSKYVSRDINVFMLDEILTSISLEQINLSAIGQIYHLVYLTQNTDLEDDNAFNKLDRLLLEVNVNLDPTEANSIYTSLINYCIGKINKGNRTFLQKLLNIYKTLINLNLILDSKTIAPIKYRNIIVTALRVGDSSWAEKFALDFGEYLPEKIKENQLRYQLSVIYFYKKEFQKVIEVLRNVEFQDVIDNLLTRATLIQTYYELNEFEALDSLLKSLGTYITRHKELDSGRRSNYKNLIKIMTQMIQIIPGDKKKIDKLKTMLSEMKGIAVNRTWLEEKIVELEK